MASAWLSLDTDALVELLSTKLDAAATIVRRAIPGNRDATKPFDISDVEDVSAKLPNIYHGDKFAFEDHIQYVQKFFFRVHSLDPDPALFYDDTTLPRDLANFFPDGTVPPLPLPPNYAKDFTGPRVLMPIFRRHYHMFRVVILAGARAASMFLRDYNFDDPKILNDISIYLPLFGTILTIPAYWAIGNECINARLAPDIVLLEGALEVIRLALTFATARGKPTMGPPNSTYARVEASGVMTTLLGAVPMILETGALNPSPWMRSHKQRFATGSEPPNASPCFVLRRLILDILDSSKPILAESERPADMSTRFRQTLGKLAILLSIVQGEYLEIEWPHGPGIGSPRFSLAKSQLPPTDSAEWTQLLAMLVNDQTYSTIKHKDVVRDFCDVCGSSQELKRCSRCLVGRFCSAECQKTGYPMHKRVCFDGKKWPPAV